MPRLARLTEHWQLKLLSVVFAVALWIFVAAEDTGDAVYVVPLDLTEVPPGLEVTGLGTSIVEVRLQGLRHVLERIDERQLQARVSLRGARTGDVVLRVRPDDVVVPRGVHVARVTPSQIRVTLEPRTGRSRP
jgi:hypothetical protein